MEEVGRSLRRRLEREKYDEEYYSTEYWREDLPGRVGHTGRSYDDPRHEKRFSLIVGIIADELSATSILDAGCATGGLLKTADEEGISIYGFDVSSIAIRQVPNVLQSRVVVAGLEAVPFQSACSDVVVCSDVLEHIPAFDIRRCVRELERLAERYVMATINSDNPYEYHPTIMPREAWERIFREVPGLTECPVREARLQQAIQRVRPEYEVYLYRCER